MGTLNKQINRPSLSNDNYWEFSYTFNCKHFAVALYSSLLFFLHSFGFLSAQNTICLHVVRVLQLPGKSLWKSLKWTFHSFLSLSITLLMSSNMISGLYGRSYLCFVCKCSISIAVSVWIIRMFYYRQIPIICTHALVFLKYCLAEMTRKFSPRKEGNGIVTWPRMDSN